MRRAAGMNQHQKAAHRPGERRIGPDEVAPLLEAARSADPEERLTAARFLCPCHVRRRVAAVWEALFRLLEDPDVRVRRAAWHTLEDGGRPDDPALDAILERVLGREKDRQVLRSARQAAAARRAAPRPTGGRFALRERGRCDFCGESGIEVAWDADTPVPTEGLPRAARICRRCLEGAER